MNQNIVFRLLPRMNVLLRISIALLLFGIGVLWQYISGNPSPGFVIVLMSSILVMYKGIDKRVFSNAFHHNTDWKKIEREQVQQILDTQRSLKKWDHSLYETSGCLGGFMFLLAIGMSLILILAGMNNVFLICIGIDMLVLFLPQFLSGMKRIDQMVKPVLYARKSLEIASMIKYMYPDVKIEFLVLLGLKKKDKKPVPKEIKLKFTFKDAPDDFMGMYGQVSVNLVGSNMYPYIYTVQVFKEGSGLKKKMEKIQMSNKKIIKEYTQEQGVEVMVIRPKTTRTSGYHTKTKDIELVLQNSMQAFELLCK